MHAFSAFSCRDVVRYALSLCVGSLSHLFSCIQCTGKVCMHKARRMAFLFASSAYVQAHGFHASVFSGCVLAYIITLVCKSRVCVCVCVCFALSNNRRRMRPRGVCYIAYVWMHVPVARRKLWLSFVCFLCTWLNNVMQRFGQSGHSTWDCVWFLFALFPSAIKELCVFADHRRVYCC